MMHHRSDTKIRRSKLKGYHNWYAYSTYQRKVNQSSWKMEAMYPGSSLAVCTRQTWDTLFSRYDEEIDGLFLAHHSLFRFVPVGTVKKMHCNFRGC
jgi:hypothetical protein